MDLVFVSMRLCINLPIALAFRLAVCVYQVASLPTCAVSFYPVNIMPEFRVLNFFFCDLFVLQYLKSLRQII